MIKSGDVLLSQYWPHLYSTYTDTSNYSLVVISYFFLCHDESRGMLLFWILFKYCVYTDTMLLLNYIYLWPWMTTLSCSIMSKLNNTVLFSNVCGLEVPTLYDWSSLYISDWMSDESTARRWTSQIYRYYNFYDIVVSFLLQARRLIAVMAR